MICTMLGMQASELYLNGRIVRVRVDTSKNFKIIHVQKTGVGIVSPLHNRVVKPSIADQGPTAQTVY